MFQYCTVLRYAPMAVEFRIIKEMSEKTTVDLGFALTSPPCLCCGGIAGGLQSNYALGGGVLLETQISKSPQISMTVVVGHYTDLCITSYSEAIHQGSLHTMQCTLPSGTVGLMDVIFYQLEATTNPSESRGFITK